MGDAGGGGGVRERAGLGGFRLSTPYLRDPRSLFRPKNDGFVPETELKLMDLYRTLSLSTYGREREKVRDWEHLECQRHICEIQGLALSRSIWAHQFGGAGSFPRQS